MIFCIQWRTVDDIQIVFLIYVYSMWQSGYFLWYSIWYSDCLLDILDTVDGILQDAFFLLNTYCRGCSSCFLDILSDWYSKHDREHYRRRLDILNRINSFQEDNSNVKCQLPYPLCQDRDYMNTSIQIIGNKIARMSSTVLKSLELKRLDCH